MSFKRSWSTTNEEDSEDTASDLSDQEEVSDAEDTLESLVAELSECIEELEELVSLCVEHSSEITLSLQNSIQHLKESIQKSLASIISITTIKTLPLLLGST